ncbi:helix-turn-helix domain-containing protein [Bradyrhizobium glycinis]|uniref:helix-turn-helix domain-containing protein n=1 Tax=Bradyrhizobium glycinis TaxID=2751812 RepID=UPI0018D5D4C0|nr:helix-turn-helix domain-containing protein [Bradyrhizobium glycinis]MBH5367273.1 AraC family transcriptional regulator [Bradyrhizobium glycinis]
MSGVVGIIERGHGGSSISCGEITLNGFEQLRAATPTSSAEIIQLQPGRMQGRLKHASVAGLSLGFGTFSHGVISRGVYSDERITIGFLTQTSRQRTRQRGIGGIRIWSPGVEHQSRYVAGVSFGALSVSTGDMARFFGPDSRFSEPTVWLGKSTFRTNPETGDASASVLRSIMAGFDRYAGKLGPPEAEYWKRAILESACYAIANSERSDVFVSSPQRLVRRAQEYLDASGDAPIHISQLLSSLRVSRRALHRAFDEVLGIPPMRYLRQKRLCEARLFLQQGATTDLTVAEVAFKQGFSDFSRFSAYYRALFGENPSETLSRHPIRS